MPGFRTHYLFGEKAKPNIKAVDEHPKVYSLGQQGPDIFFYYPPSHFIHSENIGIRMHKEGASAFFRALFKARNKILFKKSRDICDAYILGFIGHYTLDTVAHPYVHYRTKKPGLSADDRTMYRYGIHVLLETDIDAEVLMREHGLTPNVFSSETTINLSLRELYVVSVLMKKAIKEAYPQLSLPAFEIGLAACFIKHAQRLMKDDKGMKKVLMRRIDSAVYGSAVFSSLIAKDGYRTYSDPCNLRHKTWHNPWKPSFTSNKDFYELMDEAAGIFNERASLYRDMITGKEDSGSIRRKLVSHLGDKCYDSGLTSEPFHSFFN